MSHIFKEKLKKTTQIASKKGVSVVEYSILLGLIGAVAVGTLLTFSFNLTKTFDTSQENLEAAQGVGDGTYLTFDDAVNERRCYIATDSNDNVNTSLLEPDENCVYLLKGNDRSNFSTTTGLSIYPGPGVDELTVNGATDMTVFFEAGYDTYNFVGSDGPSVRLPFPFSQATFAPDDLDANPRTNGWLSYNVSGPDGTVKIVNSLRHDSSNAVGELTFSDGTNYTPLQIFNTTLQSQMTTEMILLFTEQPSMTL